MKYLDRETCEYLVSLGCTSESGYWYSDHPTDPYSVHQRSDDVPAFSLEDILRKDNAEKITQARNRDLRIHVRRGPNCSVTGTTKRIVELFQSHPDTWPEEVAKLIHPTS